ncbi:alpha/beta fold hydrolase [Kineosporia babensis]|uniref:Alpha/beta hydrolase n=1 Tax=Kineosporia babensis TaxID=499548 RepID=A0A9X1SSS8_9ACTN|nr:alpha/beta hydrolase [Kineosporia babensis]MCD5310631.1 alpha/beta hydrolase [Kineosporia babensis]
MTVVFVHGVPETPALWEAVRNQLPVDSVALRLPGFGSPHPPTLTDKNAYAAWLAEELQKIGGDIDLVGHDWGGHLAMRVVSAFPEAGVRSWVSDVAYGWHPDYQWHPIAALWQQSPEGEQFLASVRSGVPGTFGQLLGPRGLTAEVGDDIDAAHDESMDAAILALYRSAQPNFHADWNPGSIDVPGLVLVPTGDVMDGVDPADVLLQNQEVARMTGARLQELNGVGHYWMLQNPELAADTLRAFWAELP